MAAVETDSVAVGFVLREHTMIGLAKSYAFGLHGCELFVDWNPASNRCDEDGQRSCRLFS